MFHTPVRRTLKRAIGDSEADGLATAVADLANALKAGLSDAATRQNILAVRTQSQTYEVVDNIDLVDFCSLIAQATSGSEIAKRCQDIIQAVQSAYVVTNGSKGAAVKNSHGVAIYFPTGEVSPLYAGLDFSKKTGWDDFIKAYITAVRNR